MTAPSDRRAQDAGTSTPDAEDAQTLKRAAAAGVQWSFLATLASDVGRLAFSLVLARLVGPESFGIVSQATIYVTLTNLLLDQGMGMALVQKRRLDDEDVGAVTALNLIMTAVLVTVTLLVAPTIADLFDTPELTAVLRVLAIGVVIKGFAVVPNALVNRQLRFKSLAGIQVVSVALGGAVGIAAASAGADHWALVVQTLVIDSSVLVGLLVLTGRPRVQRSFQRLREMTRFSGYLFGAQLLGFLNTNLDNILIANRLAARELAFYAVSYRFLTMPLATLGSVVNRVTMPIFSRSQDDIPRVRSWFLAATRLSAVASFPFFTFLVVAAPDVVVLGFGDDWRPAIVPLQVLALVGLSRGIRLLLPPLCIALGRTDINFRWSAATVAVSAPSFVIGINWGIVGVAVAFAIVNAVMGVGHVLYAGRLIDVGLSVYGRLLVPLVTCSGLFAGAWLAVRHGTAAAGAPTVPAAIGATAVALLVYAGALRLLATRTVADAQQMLRLMRRGDRAAPEAA